MEFDRYDARILAALQRDGRLSVVELAESIGLTFGAALRTFLRQFCVFLAIAETALKAGQSHSVIRDEC